VGVSLLYEGDLVPGVLLSVAAGSLTALLGLWAAPGYTNAFRRLPTHLLLALTYLPLLAVLVDVLSGPNRSPTTWAVLLLLALVVGLLGIHALALVAYRQRRSIREGDEKLAALLAANQESPPMEAYRDAVHGAGAGATVTDVVERLVHEIRQDTGRLVVEDLREASYKGSAVVGWSQFFGSSGVPSAIGSAYGLRLAYALDLADAKLDMQSVARSILAMQRPNGGWSARSQKGDDGHLEVTAWVLPPLLRTGVSADERKTVLATFDGMLSTDDEVGFSSTLVVSTALSALAQVNPQSEHLPRLRARLLNGARAVESVTGRMVAWAYSLEPGKGDLSTAHTARALLALERAAGTGAARGDTQDALAAGLQWLREHANLGLFEEPIRRNPGEEGNDLIVVGHFTPAWVARVLLHLGDRSDLSRLRDAVRAITAQQKNGAWIWPGSGAKPLWMAYQGTSVLAEYAVRNMPWPP
jgi:hypothetical protein